MPHPLHLLHIHRDHPPLPHRGSFVCLFVYVLSANAFEKGLFTSESQDIIKQYLCFTLNENHDHDDESDCINADDINDDDQDAHSSIDGDAEDSDEQDSQKSNNINNIILHNFNKTL